MKDFIQLHQNDNVVIALKDLKAKTVITVDGQAIQLQEDVDRGHKIAIRDIKENENVIKYGFPIGHATMRIKKGCHGHTHNVKTNLDTQLAYTYSPELNTTVTPFEHREIHVYHRKNGEIGIRNELWIIPTVGCINKLAQRVKSTFLKEMGQLSNNVDGVFVFEHAYGCSQMGDDHITTKAVLQNITLHPNAGAVLVIGLGCENNQVAAFKETLGDHDSERIKFMIAQQQDDEIAAGVALVQALYEVMKNDQRQPAPLSSLRVGLECGGSDGFSGITANPLLGYFSDYLIGQGATTVLTEVPEMFGAETILMNRCETEAVFHQTVNLINDFKQYYEDNNQVCYENPSPGNKAGGITTLEDKSLGCTQKAGTSNVVDVLLYTERLKKKGLNLLQAPGNDLVATTALGATGSHLVLFTTGRGTPYGGFVPTVKVATNREMALKKPHWIDFDASLMLERSVDDVLAQFVDHVIEVVNGKWTQNETNDYREIAVWKFGVTL
ncbi:MAG: altronate dehydratase family protein [Defluviitaleaceae bacterium]|nr:altronate dehydratase family protein [Defluviitaleaceae bacterium]